MRFPWSSALGRDRSKEEKAAIKITPPIERTLTVEVPVYNKSKRRKLTSYDSHSKRTPPSSDNASVEKPIAPVDSEDIDAPVVNRLGSAQPQMPGKRGRPARPSEPKRKRCSRTAAKKDEMGRAGALDNQDMAVAPHEQLPAADEMDTDPPHEVVSLTPLQQSIESQFSLEILLKHQELRLIEQELAKCQVAYEQLRRCRLLPPTEADPASMTTENMTTTTEAADVDLLLPPRGVVNGPYSQHYARWLLPHPTMLRQPIEPIIETPPPVAGKGNKGRATRGSLAEDATTSSHVRARAAKTSPTLQALPSGYPVPKDKAGPLILKRSTDGNYVKLVCVDCHRSDFSSAQGFINHCRIAHHRGFESHDAAAIVCGQIVEMDEVEHATGTVTNTSGNTTSLVHPLARTAPTSYVPVVSASNRLLKKPNAPEVKPGVKGEVNQRIPSTPPVEASSSGNSIDRHPDPLVPSPQIPYLSALMQGRGIGGDLQAMVGEVRDRPNLEDSWMDEDEYEGDSNDTSPVHAIKNDPGQAFAPGSRTPTRAGTSPAPLGRSNGRKGTQVSRKPGHVGGISPSLSHAKPVSTTRKRTGRAPTAIDSTMEVTDDAASTSTAGTADLSPNTLDPTKAPSLVSDDGEYEAHTESESPASDVSIHDGVDIDMDDDEVDGEPRTSHNGPDADMAHPKSSTSRMPRRTAMRQQTANNGDDETKEERHVTFASPVKDGGRRGRGAKRRARR